MRIIYKAAARKDIEQTRDYIRDELKNPTAAQKFVTNVLRAGSLLLENPEMGTLLSSKYDVPFETRFLVVQKHLFFYDIEGETILVIRVIDGRRDYLALLF